jgi:hypothetical protein
MRDRLVLSDGHFVDPGDWYDGNGDWCLISVRSVFEMRTYIVIHRKFSCIGETRIRPRLAGFHIAHGAVMNEDR